MSRRQIFLLLFSFCIAAASGGLVRIVFSPQRLQSIVSRALKSESLAVDFTARKMELSLARGAWPQIALRVEGLEIIENDRCFRNSVWRIDEVYFPLRITRLIRGEVLLGKILAQNIDLNLGATVGVNPCIENNSAASVSPREPQAVNSLAPKNLFDYTLGIYVSQLKIRHQSRPDYIVKVSELGIGSGPRGIDFSGTVSASTASVSNEEWPSVKVLGSVIKGQVNARLLGRWQEGVVNIDLNYSAQEKVPLKIGGQMKHLPLANFLKLYEQVNGQPVGTYPRSMWLNCDLNVESTVEQLQTSSPVFSNCLVEGDAGTWESPRMVFDLEQGLFKESFEVKIAHLPLKTLMGILQIDVFDGVLNQYGQLSGSIKVRTPEELNFEGYIEDLEVYFSNKNIRSHQAIKKVKVEVEKKAGRVSGQFSDFELRKGQLDGLISFNFDKSFSNGVVQAQAKRLVLDPSIQELLVKEKLGKIEAYGKFKVSDSRLDVFKGDIGLEDLENQDVKIKSLKTNISYMSQTLRLSAKSKSLQLNTSSSLFNSLRPLLLDKSFSDPWLELSDMSVNISGMRQQLEWKKGVVLIPSERVSIGTEGVWQEGMGLAGWVSVDFPTFKLMRWDVSGELNNPRFLPSSQWLKELVTEKPKKKKKR